MTAFCFRLYMVNDFEKLARDCFDMPYALATTTGSGSFFCALAGLGLGPGDEVIVPAFSWYTDYEAPMPSARYGTPARKCCSVEPSARRKPS